MSWKIRNKVLALKFFNETVHEDPLLDKWIAITDFMYVKKLSESIILCQ
jgi:hypothetical protein